MSSTAADIDRVFFSQHPNAIEARQIIEDRCYRQFRTDATLGRSRIIDGRRVPLCTLSDDKLRALASEAARKSLAEAEHRLRRRETGEM